MLTLRQNIVSTRICSIEPDMLLDIEPDLSSNKIRPCDLPFGTFIILRKILSSNLYDANLLISMSPVSEIFALLYERAALRISNSLARRPMYRSFRFLNCCNNSVARPGCNQPLITNSRTYWSCNS